MVKRSILPFFFFFDDKRLFSHIFLNENQKVEWMWCASILMSYRRRRRRRFFHCFYSLRFFICLKLIKNKKTKNVDEGGKKKSFHNFFVAAHQEKIKEANVSVLCSIIFFLNLFFFFGCRRLFSWIFLVCCYFFLMVRVRICVGVRLYVPSSCHFSLFVLQHLPNILCHSNICHSSLSLTRNIFSTK